MMSATRPIASIDLRTGLPKARAVLDTLVPGSRTYSAPCVVGVMMDEGARRKLDGLGGSAVWLLADRGKVAVPAGQFYDIDRLQRAFDSDEDFPQIFAELEAKYCTEQVQP